MTLRDNLIHYMKIRGLTIKDLSHITAISEPTLKRLRSKSNANPTLDVLMKISSALGISIDNLIHSENEPQIYKQDEAHTIPKNLNEFILLFTRNTFNFHRGTKAVFKKHRPSDPITKYILTKDWKILEKVDQSQMLFQDEKFVQFCVMEDFIHACIVRELYEVNYV